MTNSSLLDGDRFVSERLLWFTVVSGGCTQRRLLSDRQWERVHSSVMRLTCGSITKVMMSSLDGEVTVADSFRQHTAVTVTRHSGRNSPEKTGYSVIFIKYLWFLFLLVGSDGWWRSTMQDVSVVGYCESEIAVVCDAVWLTRNTMAVVCFAPLTGKKMSSCDYWLWRPVTLSTAEHAKQSVYRQ